MTATTSPPDKLEPREPTRKRQEIDPEHDIDAKKTVIWLSALTVFVFASLWILLQVFGVVIFGERRGKIEVTAPTGLEELLRQERTLLSEGTRADGSRRMSIEEAMQRRVDR